MLLSTRWTEKVKHALEAKARFCVGKEIVDDSGAPSDWRPLLLRAPALILATTGTLGLGLTTLALLIYSVCYERHISNGHTEMQNHADLHKMNNNGIATIHTGEQEAVLGSSGLALRGSLAWTFVPVLVFQTLILGVDAVVVAAGSRQPYVEMSRGAPAEKSIELDYTAEPAIKKPLKALRLKHFALAYSFAVRLAVKIVLAALAAYLLDTASIQMSYSQAVTQHVQFSNESTLALDDFEPIFDIAAATMLYGGQQIPWTAPDYALLPVELGDVLRISSFTLNATAYNVEVDCRALSSPSQFQIGRTSREWEVETGDRGCNFQSIFAPSGQLDTKEFLHTYQQTCSLEAGSSRIIVVAALAADDSVMELANRTAVSCTTAYYSTTGLLSLSVDPARMHDPTINSFLRQSSTLFKPRPGFGSSIEEQINQGTVVDPTNRISATNFGRLILTYAKSLSSSSYLDGGPLQRATEDLYKSIFAISTNRFLIEPSAPKEIDGIAHKVETRLIVVPIVAYLVIVFLAAIEVMLIWIYLYTQKHKSVLYEKPRGILGAAAILRNSCLVNRVEELGGVSLDGKVAAAFSKTKETTGPWIYTDWYTPSKARLTNSKVAGTTY